MKTLRGQVVALTGAGSGIGRALAIRLAGEGMALALADIDADGLAQTAKLLGDAKVTTRRVDVSKEAEVAAFALAVQQEHGGASVLINNAGVALHGLFEEQTTADFEWLMGINFWGTVYGTRAFLPQLLAKDQAHLVNLSSVFGLVAPPGQAAYSASKFAVRGFTESIRHEFAGSTLGVTVVHPGGIKTQIATRARAPQGFSAEEAQKRAEHFNRLAARTPPEKAARAIVRAIRANKPRLLIGPDAHLLDRIARSFPERYWAILGGVMDSKGWFKSRLARR
jgi:NADP-dependent 3-hydroxy acid dehydrogenase YdfG